MQSLHTEGPERAEEHPPLVFLLAWTKNEVFFHEQKRKFQEDKDSSPDSDQFDPEAPAPGVAGDGCCQSTALVPIVPSMTAANSSSLIPMKSSLGMRICERLRLSAAESPPKLKICGRLIRWEGYEIDPIFPQVFPDQVPSQLQAADQGGDMSTNTYVEGVRTSALWTDRSSSHLDGFDTSRC